MSLQEKIKSYNYPERTLVNQSFVKAYYYFDPDHYMDMSDPKRHRILKGVDSHEIMENRVKYCNEIVENAFENML